MRSRIHDVCAGLFWVILSVGVARAADAVFFDLPAQPLADSLIAVANQTDTNIYINRRLVGERRAPALREQLTVDEAIERLLAGTGLQIRRIDEKTVTLVGAAVGSSANGEGQINLRVAEGSTESEQGSESKDKLTSSSSGTDVKLEEVVVTAQKRAVAENIKDVPMTINAISGESLATRGIGDVKELTFAVPSLSFHSYGAGSGRLNIRGIGGERGTAPLVGIYLDEVPTVSGFLLNGIGEGLDVRTYDLERVEVLKGPQGTLFGESSLGGLIRYVTKDPKLDRVEGRVEGTFFGTKDGDPSEQLVGAFNVPLLNDVLGLRIAGTYERNGGWIDQLADWNGPIMHHDINDNSLTDVRAKLLYVSTNALKVSALVDVHRNNVGALNIVNVHPFDKSEFVQGADHGVDHDYPTDAYDNFNVYNLTAQYDFGFATLLSSTSHFDSRVRSGHSENPVSNLGAHDQLEPLGFFAYELLIRPSVEGAIARVTSQELRLTSNRVGPVKWLVGGSWKKSRSLTGHSGGADFFFPAFSGGIYDYGLGLSGASSSEIVAGFADGSYTFFDRLEIGGGARVYDENQDSKNFDVNDVLTLGQSGTFKKTTYRAFVKYRLSDQVNLYANIATGFRSGIFNGQQAVDVGAPLVTKPENSIFYEAGMKAAFLDKALSLDLALFSGRYRDQLQGAVIASSPPTGYFTNAGSANIKGVEWLVSAVPVRGLKFSLGGDVLSSAYTKVNPGNPTIVGDPMDFVPRDDLTFTTDYAFDWGSNLPGFVNVSYSRKGPQQITNRVSGFGLYWDHSAPVNLLQASLGATVNGFELTLFARNILDERQSLNPNWAAAWNQERPRSIGLSIAKSFSAAGR